ncbi:MAG TPA: PAS domain S-box protein [Bacteroidota bacterium]|nr:PAS domain S-box protein [Bacteroidota bacterium]
MVNSMELNDKKGGYYEIFNCFNEWVFEIDKKGKIVYSNDIVKTILKLNKEEILNRFLFDFVSKDEVEKIINKLDNILLNKENPLFETILKDKNNNNIFVEISINSISTEINKNDTFICICRDISSRKLLESKYQNTILEFNAIFKALPDLHFTIDEFNRITNFHAGDFSKLYLPPEKFINKNISELFPQRLSEDFINLIERTRKTATVQSLEYFLEMYDGLRYFEIRTSMIDNKNLIAIVRDITDRINIIKELEKQKEQLAVTLRSIGDGVIATDIDGNITLINKIAEILTGWSSQEAIGKSIFDVFKIIDEKTRESKQELISTVLKLGGFLIVEKDMVLIMKDGTERPITDSIAPIRDRESKIIGVVVVFREFTEQALTEKRITHVDKLESIGLLAGGIAHDFNNILTSIVGNISLAKFYAKNEEKVYKRLKEAEIACEHAKDLTRQLLTFAKDGNQPVKQVIRIEELVKESSSFVLSGSKSKIEYWFSEDIMPVEVDPGQISQVINNIVINADQAMPNGGVISISVSNYIQNKNYSNVFNKGDYVLIQISDTGVGIEKELLNRIFDPYFTTKSTGNGLGLSVCYSIIKKHNGFIEVFSEVGKGTTFKIYLPATDKEVQKEDQKMDEVTSGSARILVMDDEELIQSICKEILINMGHKVETVSSGEEAIKIFKERFDYKEKFDLVIMDLTIPGGLGGKDTLVEIKRIDPSIKAIVVSGYSNDPVMANYKEYGFDDMLTKPYKFEDLTITVNRILSK